MVNYFLKTLLTTSIKKKKITTTTTASTTISTTSTNRLFAKNRKRETRARERAKLANEK